MESAIDEILRLGLKCNLDCIFCNILGNENLPELDLEEAKKQLDSISDNDYVSISGGEPLLYPYLPRLVEYGVKKGIDLQVQTNATLVSRGLAESLRKAGLEKVFVNLPSSDPETYAKLTGTNPKMFNAAVRGIKTLENAGIKVILNLVVNNLNHGEMSDYLIFVKENFLGVELVNFSIIQPHGRAKKNSHLVPDYRKIKRSLAEALETSTKIGINVLNPFCGLPMCMVPEELMLHENSEFLSGKIVRRQGIDSISEPLQKVIRSKVHTEKCGDCLLKNMCLGVWKAYYEIKGDVVEPPQRALRFWPQG